MCRLFGLSAAPHRVRATFWLLEAPDSLAEQSRREPDGTGLGVFSENDAPRVFKEPLPAYRDRQFSYEARELESATFVAHIRYASTGGLDVPNTHPFEQHGRLFAHNGVVENLPALDAELGAYRDLVGGDTDSERLFALITKYADIRDGDVNSAIEAAVRWMAAELPVYALNFVLISPTEMWALRYPDVHSLFVLERRAGGPLGSRHLEHASAAGRIRVRSGALSGQPAVVVASERMDDDPGWQALCPGELLHVDDRLNATRRVVIDHAPRHPLALEQLGAHAVASQAGS
ncbi:class II glutamine amidotransferase [Allokutzneria oryzae]|uniref:Class II glutamine amidotransferase n=1 Tax=Allokutzneria oryzae TaxID=1378989 RepID=A0ABV5ZQN4_9PSEU